METFSSSDIESWQRFYRSNFINSLTGFKSVSLVGTCDSGGKTNLAIFSSIIHIGSNPSLIGFINRPVKAGHHTLANIESTKQYTINHISIEMLDQAHQTSAKYPYGISEFDATGLTTEFHTGILAPFVKESKVKYSLTLADIIHIELNQCILVIGKPNCIIIEKNILSSDGFLNLEKAGSLAGNGNDSYYSANLVGRYANAKPEEKYFKLD